MPEVLSIEDPLGNVIEPNGSTPLPADPTVDATEPEEITPETELFSGGPTKEVIDQWKAQYGDVYVTEVAEEKYIVWRTLRRAEYRQLVGDMERLIADGASNAEATMTNEEAMTKVCVLWPEKLSVTSLAGDLAGMPSIISQQIMEASGFLSLQVRAL